MFDITSLVLVQAANRLLIETTGWPRPKDY